MKENKISAGGAFALIFAGGYVVRLASLAIGSEVTWGGGCAILGTVFLIALAVKSA